MGDSRHAIPLETIQIIPHGVEAVVIGDCLNRHVDSLCGRIKAVALVNELPQPQQGRIRDLRREAAFAALKQAARHAASRRSRRRSERMSQKDLLNGCMR